MSENAHIVCYSNMETKLILKKGVSYLLLTMLGFLACSSSKVHIPPFYNITPTENPNAFRFSFRPVASTDFTTRDIETLNENGDKQRTTENYVSQNWQFELFEPVTIGVSASIPFSFGPLVSPMGFIKYRYSYRDEWFLYSFIPWLSIGYTNKSLGNWYEQPMSVGLIYSFVYSKFRAGSSFGFYYSKSYNFHNPQLYESEYAEESIKANSSFTIKTEEIAFPIYFGLRGVFISITPSYLINFRTNIINVIDTTRGTDQPMSVNSADNWQFHISVGLDLKTIRKRVE